MKISGPKSREWLHAVGIETIEQVEELGVVESYLRVRRAFPDKVSLNMLWGLQGMLMGLKWNQIPESIRADLLEELSERETEE